jgi:hypothetical protein
LKDPAVDLPHAFSPEFSPEEAASWLRSVDGELYRTPRGSHADRAWVAVVRTPRFGTERGRLIVALGDTSVEAATAAASEWLAVWNRAPRVA